jgi:hypothetical protein
MVLLNYLLALDNLNLKGTNLATFARIANQVQLPPQSLLHSFCKWLVINRDIDVTNLIQLAVNGLKEPKGVVYVDIPIDEHPNLINKDIA